MNATTCPSTVEQSGDGDELTDPGDLFVAYQPYSLDWLNRLRRGEFRFTPPSRLSGRGTS